MKKKMENINKKNPSIQKIQLKLMIKIKIIINNQSFKIS